MDKSPPDGFSPWTRSGSPVTNAWEPIYEKNSDACIEIGMFVRDVHTNRRGLLHGGVIAALCDIAMGYSLGIVLRKHGVDVGSLLTTHLAVDYIGKSENGWLQITPKIIHAGRNTGITEAGVFADGDVIAHAKANFRMMAVKAD